MLNVLDVDDIYFMGQEFCWDLVCWTLCRFSGKTNSFHSLNKSGHKLSKMFRLNGCQQNGISICKMYLDLQTSYPPTHLNFQRTTAPLVYPNIHSIHSARLNFMAYDINTYEKSLINSLFLFSYLCHISIFIANIYIQTDKSTKPLRK